MGGTIYMFECKQCNWLLHFNTWIIGWQFLDLMKDLPWSNVFCCIHCNIPHFLLRNIIDWDVITNIFDVVFYMMLLFWTWWTDCCVFALQTWLKHMFILSFPSLIPCPSRSFNNGLVARGVQKQMPMWWNVSSIIVDCWLLYFTRTLKWSIHGLIPIY